ncbi:XRE family transcriptional regulator [bacterium 1XD42-1]|nr:XRE family transcriptional regulator [bacterium 1XD42-8]RKJ61061.1 XRE family transcriptional regulator [bacterium 1XD42-1]
MQMFTYKVFVQNIKRLIEVKGLKQCAVANKAGFSEQEFSNMLNGRKIIKAEDVAVIAGALDATPNDLFIDNSLEVTLEAS